MRRVLLILLCLTAAWQGVATTAMHDIRGLATVNDRPAANVVVWIDGPPAAHDPLPTPIVDQRNFAFYPRVLAVQAGTAVEFPNHDRVFHNVFSFLNGKKFDLGIYPAGTVKRIMFDKPGVSRLFCNIHPHMAAYIMAVPSQYFAVSDEAGAFTIRGLAPGTYTYHVWRAGGTETSGTAAMDSTSRLDIRCK
jgi:plastocyanin